MSGKLTFKRFVLIVAEVYDAPADVVEQRICRSRAEAALATPFPGPNEIVLYPDPVERAALCCVAIISLRPLPSDNKKVAYSCMLEMLARYPWARLDADRREISMMLNGLGEEAISEDEFVCWVRAQLGLAEWLRYQRRRRARA